MHRKANYSWWLHRYKCTTLYISLVTLPYLGESTKFPSDWIPLLQEPCEYLLGPACPRPYPIQNIGIVGAGMAGLTMAYLLQTVGHNVCFVYLYSSLVEILNFYRLLFLRRQKGTVVEHSHILHLIIPGMETLERCDSLHESKLLSSISL